MNFVREVKVYPAYDKRHPEPSKNYGIGAARIAFYLKGDAGTMQFVFNTGYYLPHVREEFKQQHYHPSPMPVDVGYHSKNYISWAIEMADCPVLGCTCYYDGSSLAANSLFELMLQEGEEAVWKELEARYNHIFCEEVAQ